MSSYHGKFVWYELMTTDAEAAQDFYGKVIGWTAEDSGQTGMQYTILKAGDLRVGGLMAFPEGACEMGASPGWLGYVAVDDVDAMAERFKQDGGQIHKSPADIPEVGRFAVVADPQGAVVVLFKPSPAMASDAPDAPQNTPRHIGWRELHAGDGPSAFDFYARHFGWTKDRAMDMGPMGVYQLFAYDGEARGGMMTRHPQMPHPGWLYYINVPDVDRVIRLVGDGGGKVLQGPMEVPGGDWIAQFEDPQGAMFAVVGKRPAAA